MILEEVAHSGSKLLENQEFYLTRRLVVSNTVKARLQRGGDCSS